MPALVAAEAGIPVGFMTMVSCAFSGPATLAGSLVVGNAEVISALALMQLAFPGSPVYYAAAQTAMDLRSGAYTGGGPEDFLFGAATNELADFYNVPLSMGAYATGAKRPDWQAGVENSLSAFMASIVGSDMLLGAGLLHGSRIWSYEQLILDTEIDGIVRATLRGVPVSDATLALEAIREVGPGGDYLTAEHTRSTMRGLWQSRYLDRRPYGQWEADPDTLHRGALERARTLLRDHRPDGAGPGARCGAHPDHREPRPLQRLPGRRRLRPAGARPCPPSPARPTRRFCHAAPLRAPRPRPDRARPRRGAPAAAQPGIKVEEPEATALLVSGGADGRRRAGAIPEAMVRRALDSAPRSFNLFDRSGRPAVRYGQGIVHFDPGRPASPFSIRRPSTRASRRPPTSPG